MERGVVEYIYLIKLFQSEFARKKNTTLGGWHKHKCGLKKEFKVALGFSENASHLNYYFDKWIRDKIMIAKGSVIVNKKSRKRENKYYINCDKAYFKILDNNNFNKDVNGLVKHRIMRKLF